MTTGFIVAGVPFVLLEASDGVGGRVRTDEVDGFLLDRGFQIFLTSYPECKVVRQTAPPCPRAWQLTPMHPLLLIQQLECCNVLFDEVCC